VPGSRKRYGRRFVLVYGALALVLAAAAVGLVLILTTSQHKTGPIWSSWKPVGNDPQVLTDQIAQHVGGEYRFSDGKAIVGIQATAPTVATLPVAAVELRGQASVQGSIIVHRTDHAWQYQLCGGGTACSISRGKPSGPRGAVIRREAFELALYTFKYVPAVDSVIAMLPPAPPVTTSSKRYILYVRRADLKSELVQPLRASLPRTAPLKLKTPTLKAAAIDTIATKSLFAYQPEQLQDGTVILVLDPPS
jgi:hypothetical protein